MDERRRFWLGALFFLPPFLLMQFVDFPIHVFGAVLWWALLLAWSEWYRRRKARANTHQATSESEDESAP
ncbi:hypothetical protein [Nocardiopsis lambiniae]|uniref:DUF3311 domain-containing protein n=1 Tax=Nocardiopsis lambiniae TaxID=3075539 RepID=A0ABU2MEB1_9ACTN|nr:hypothetical protein [Nocardiopsis sp. DSM 44743]MDT0331028.1 hypothetical protein [Nocardiopsis sp. DSM 44743]